MTNPPESPGAGRPDADLSDAGLSSGTSVRPAAGPEAAARAPSYKAAAIKGAWWVTGARVFRSVSSIVTLSVLSRFLTPEEFGLAGLVIFVTGFAQVFGDFGTRLALVQRPDIDDLDTNSVFWFNLSLGIVLTVATMLFATEISWIFSTPGMEAPLRWAAPAFLLVSLQGVPSSLLERKLQFNVIAMSETIGTLVGAVTAIVMVLIGFRLGALIGQLLAIAVVSTIFINLKTGWWPRLMFSWQRLKPMLIFGSWAATSSMVVFIGANIERPILAAMISAAALGYFSLAHQIVVTPLRTVVQVVRKLTMPIFARMQDDKPRARQAYLSVEHALMVIMAPICFGLIAVADPFIGLLLGDGWEPVVPLLILLALRGLLSTINDSNAAILTSHGWVRFQFGWSVFSVGGSGLVLWLTAPHGVEAAVVARLVFTAVISPFYCHFVLRLLDQSWGGFLVTIGRPFLAGLGMCAAVWLLLQQLGGGDWLHLVIGVVVGGAVYLGLLLVLDRQRSLALMESLGGRVLGRFVRH